MKVVYVPPRHRHLPLQRMCRRHSGLTLHAGLITVSDSQTAPRTLKMSLWNLCVCRLPIIPSVWRKSKVWWFVKWEECLLSVIYWWGVILKDWCLTFLNKGRARFSNDGKSTTYWPTVYSRLPWAAPAMSLYIEMKWRLLKRVWWKRATSLIWRGWQTLLPDSGQVAPLSSHCDDIKANSPPPLSDLLCVKSFNSHAWWHQSIAGFLDQSGFPHTWNKNKTHCQTTEIHYC